MKITIYLDETLKGAGGCLQGDYACGAVRVLTGRLNGKECVQVEFKEIDTLAIVGGPDLAGEWLEVRKNRDNITGTAFANKMFTKAAEADPDGFWRAVRQAIFDAKAESHALGRESMRKNFRDLIL
jgi:hypothetical protein